MRYLLILACLPLLFSCGRSNKTRYTHSTYPQQQLQAHFDRDLAYCKEWAENKVAPYRDTTPGTDTANLVIFAINQMMYPSAVYSQTYECMEARGWTTVSETTTAFANQMDKLKPNWRKVDTSRGFGEWLDRTNQRSTLREAAQNNDTQTCIRIMEEWERLRVNYLNTLDSRKPNWRTIDETQEFRLWLDASGSRDKFDDTIWKYNGDGVVQIMEEWEIAASSFESRLTTEKPDWREIDGNEEFRVWLSDCHLLTPYIKSQQAYDPEPCVRYMNQWEELSQK